WTRNKTGLPGTRIAENCHGAIDCRPVPDALLRPSCSSDILEVAEGMPATRDCDGAHSRSPGHAETTASGQRAASLRHHPGNPQPGLSRQVCGGPRVADLGWRAHGPAASALLSAGRSLRPLLVDRI